MVRMIGAAERLADRSIVQACVELFLDGLRGCAIGEDTMETVNLGE